MKRRSLFRGALGATAIGIAGALASQPAMAEFAPVKPVEFVIIVNADLKLIHRGFVTPK